MLNLPLGPKVAIYKKVQELKEERKVKNKIARERLTMMTVRGNKGLLAKEKEKEKEEEAVKEKEKEKEKEGGEFSFAKGTIPFRRINKKKRIEGKESMFTGYLLAKNKKKEKKGEANRNQENRIEVTLHLLSKQKTFHGRELMKSLG